MAHAEPLLFLKEFRLDNELLYVFQDTTGQKRIIDGRPYVEFNFQPGMYVKAIVRGRGCAGEALVDLQHPVYKTGELYKMTIVESKTICINRVSTSFVIVMDADGCVHRIKVDNAIHIPDKTTVYCKLMDQKQGRLIFNLAYVK